MSEDARPLAPTTLIDDIGAGRDDVGRKFYVSLKTSCRAYWTVSTTEVVCCSVALALPVMVTV